MPVKIIHLITELSIGGAQSVLYNLLSHADRDNFEYSVLCFYNGDGLFAQKIRSLDIQVIDLEMTAKYHFDAFLRLYSHLRNSRPIILHNWMYHPVVVGRIIGRLARVPLIISSRHNINIGGEFREATNRLTSPLDDHVIAVCEVARRLEIERSHVPPEKVTTIYNGIQLNEFVSPAQASTELRGSLGLAPDDFVIVSTGRMHPQKDYSTLLDAVSHLAIEYPSFKLLLVGDGPLKPALEQFAQNLSVSDHVIFTGQRDDIAAILQAADLYVSSSLWEGTSISILEAMASALPIIATGVGGTPELIQPDISGILVPPGEPSKIAKAIERLYTHPAERKSLSSHARERAIQNFSNADMTKKIETLYLKLLQDKIQLKPYL
jgi:glycosyltransferase involved in cell wall biosynthesis